MKGDTFELRLSQEATDSLYPQELSERAGSYDNVHSPFNSIIVHLDLGCGFDCSELELGR